MSERIDVSSGTGMTQALAHLLARHGAPPPGAPPALWVLHQGWGSDAQLTARQVQVASVADVVPAVARCDLGKNDEAIVLVWRAALEADGSLPQAFTDASSADPDLVFLLAAATGGGAELLAAGHLREGASTVQLTGFPGRRDFPALEGLWVEALRRRAGVLSHGEPQVTPGEAYGRAWAAQVAAAAAPGGLAGAWRAWRALGHCPDVDGPGVPTPKPFSPSWRARQDKRLARTEREEHAVELARTGWHSLHSAMSHALHGRPEAELRSRARAESWVLEPHLLLWSDAPLWANLLGEVLPPLEDSLAAVRAGGPLGGLRAASLRRRLRRRDWWVEQSTPALHVRPRPEVRDQVQFVTGALPVAPRSLVGVGLRPAPVPVPPPAPAPQVDPAAAALGSPVPVPAAGLPAALAAAGLERALVGVPGPDGSLTWVAVATHAGQLLWQHPVTGAAHPWPLPLTDPDATLVWRAAA